MKTIERVIKPCKTCNGWTAQIKVGTHYICQGCKPKEYADVEGDVMDVIIKPTGRHQASVISVEGGVILFNGHGALGRGRDRCIEWCKDNGHKVVEIQKV